MRSTVISRPRCAVAGAFAVLSTAALVAANDAAPAEQGASYGAAIAIAAATIPVLRRRRGHCASSADATTGEAA